MESFQKIKAQLLSSIKAQVTNAVSDLPRFYSSIPTKISTTELLGSIAR